MITRFGLYVDLMYEMSCCCKFIIKMPEDFFRRVAMGYFCNNSGKLSLLIAGDEYFYPGDRVNEFHDLDVLAESAPRSYRRKDFVFRMFFPVEIFHGRREDKPGNMDDLFRWSTVGSNLKRT